MSTLRIYLNYIYFYISWLGSHESSAVKIMVNKLQHDSQNAKSWISVWPIKGWNVKRPTAAARTLAGKHALGLSFKS